MAEAQQDGPGTNWGQVAAGVGSTLFAGPIGGLISGGLYNAVSGLFSNRDENGLNKNTPKYTDPMEMQRRLTAQQLLDSKTGDEFSAHQSALHQHRANEMFDDLNRSFSGNPAVSSAMYNQVNENAEDQNISSNLEGTRINESNKREGLSEMNQLASEDMANWHDYVTRASAPTVTEGILSDAFANTAGGIAGAGRKVGSSLIMRGAGYGEDKDKG